MEEILDDQAASFLDSNSSRIGSSHASNKRKYNNMGSERIVVAVKIQGNGKKQRSEGSPSDCWSWRKYGQKPIKGSPYPRGYYRCSTSKNCCAKKQVERCRTDATTLIITYTCAHNHPQPHNQKQEQAETESKHQQKTPLEDHDHFQSNSPQHHHLLEENPSTPVLVYNEDRLQRSSLPLKSEENDFYDELEELPTSSFFTAFMTSDLCDTRILLNPS